MPLSSNVAALSCFAGSHRQDPHKLNTLCETCGSPLQVDLQLPDGSPSDVIRTDLSSLWRYERLLPVTLGDAVSLTEGWTPLVSVDDRN